MAEELITKPWYKSKTKWGAILFGFSAIFGTVGGYFTGNIDLGTTINSLIAEIGLIIGVMGLRDIPILNKITRA